MKKQTVNEAIGFALALTILAAFTYATFALVEKTCSDTAELMGYEYHYGVIVGCMVKVNGQWVPLSNLRMEQ